MSNIKVFAACSVHHIIVVCVCVWENRKWIANLINNCLTLMIPIDHHEREWIQSVVISITFIAFVVDFFRLFFSSRNANWLIPCEKIYFRIFVIDIHTMHDMVHLHQNKKKKREIHTLTAQTNFNWVSIFSF